MDYFGQLLANGLVLGAIYALTAVAFTLVYGVVRLVNFAFGELFMVGAFVTVSLMQDEVKLVGVTVPMPALPFPVAALGAILVTALLGVVVDRIAYRPLRNAPRLAPLITSIAVSVVLQSLAQTIWGAEELPFPTFGLSDFPPIVLFDEIYLSVMDLVVMATAVVAMIGLTLFVSCTRLGRAMRASAEDQTAARLVGVPVNRVVGAAFAIGSGFAALAGLLYAQSYGFAHATMGFLPGLKALTAAVLGGIGSIPGAALGGVVLGLVEALGAGYLPNGSAYKDAISFVLLVLLLYVRPQGLLGRPELNSAGRGSLLGGAGALGPLWVRAMFEKVDGALGRLGHAGAPVAVGALVVAVAVGALLPSDYWLRILTVVVIYGMLASGLNVIVGFAGLLDLGFVAFWAVGSYLTSILFVLVLRGTFGIEPQEVWWLLYLNLPVGGLLAALLAVVLGTPTLRLRGDYLAIMTLGFGEIVRIVAINWVGLTRGPMGIRGIPSPNLFGYPLGSARAQFFVAVVLAAIVLFAIAKLVRSYVGRAWVAIREDEEAAEAMGVPTARYKLYAYAASGFIGGFVGVFYAHYQQYISPLNFSLFENIIILMLIVLGGLGTFIGPMVGAVIWIVFLQVAIDIPFVQAYPETRFALLGVILIALMLFRPQGLAAGARVRLLMAGADRRTAR
ncbi:branched-chain amino acid transport system permease protein [Pseudoxanthobacter soli DSM 19599]|uniref:Branched-chain amino acid transport system permease protein n=1 Tax=Pseudoxanthobacter soli DSM 19599 TaxID=1123029 RepID=A0A1M7ZPE5_9HYPH|nr:ABC transporter permease [Pseudoxanthobacter soli]SHO66731.1 branched-chain amino acid transport system permease protein [Pseudoxanthobacter soli DSM 19599]